MYIVQVFVCGSWRKLKHGRTNYPTRASALAQRWHDRGYDVRILGK